MFYSLRGADNADITHVRVALSLHHVLTLFD
jgi:hypothetical protein